MVINRPEAVQARKDEEKRKAYEKKRAEIINKRNNKRPKMKSGLCWPFLMPGYQLIM